MAKKSYAKLYGQQVAERDGGWFCHYCQIQLLKPDNKTEVGYRSEIISVNGKPKSVWRHINDFDHATIDHIVARKNGGTDDLDNLVLACNLCNTARNIKDYATFKASRSVR